MSIDEEEGMTVEALGNELVEKLGEYLSRSRHKEKRYRQIICDLEQQLEVAKTRIWEMEAKAALDRVLADEETESDVPSTQADTQTDVSQVVDDVRQRNPFQPLVFKETVRQKAARKQLHGHDCPCCRKYYEAVGKAERVESISRHRYRKEDPGTPEGFWNVRFSQT
jgi:PIN domain nuclease of toxin-antitoxin system